MTELLKDIPVTLVTGMLGAGKTTLIDHLLEQRPRQQRWAVLVNEFSETGVDGERLQRDGVHVREVAGGCMGCSAAVTLRVELNRLLRQARPHRLLVEPTGLGHPRELLALFSGEFYREVLAPRATLCLVDARRLASPEFRDASLWHQQRESADVLLGSKADLWAQEDHARFEALCAERPGLASGIVPAAGGMFDTRWLDAPSGYGDAGNAGHDHHHFAAGPRSRGLTFSAETRFDSAALRRVLGALEWERIKGSLRTADGAVRIDGTAGELNIEPERGDVANRIQLIGHGEESDEKLERRILAAASPG